MLRERVRSFDQRDFASDLHRQFHSLRPLMVVIYTPVAIALLVILAVRLQTDVAIAELTRDPLQVLLAPVYTGILSTVGGLIWSSTSGICLFCYAVTRMRGVRASECRFLLAGGVVTVMLLVDDVFMLHEIVFPRYLGVPERLVYLTNAAVVLWFAVAFRSTILRSDYLLLALAFAGLGVTIGLDLVESILSNPGVYLIEDGLKLVGIVSWATYFVRVSARHVAGVVSQTVAESR